MIILWVITLIVLGVIFGFCIGKDYAEYRFRKMLSFFADVGWLKLSVQEDETLDGIDDEEDFK